jgi:hypothetical protein
MFCNGGGGGGVSTAYSTYLSAVNNICSVLRLRYFCWNEKLEHITRTLKVMGYSYFNYVNKFYIYNLDLYIYIHIFICIILYI